MSIGLFLLLFVLVSDVHAALASIESARVVNSDLIAGRDLKVDVTVKNVGNTVYPRQVKAIMTIYANSRSVKVDEVSLQGLGPGQSKTVRLNYRMANVGSYTYLVKVKNTNSGATLNNAAGNPAQTAWATVTARAAVTSAKVSGMTGPTKAVAGKSFTVSVVVLNNGEINLGSKAKVKLKLVSSDGTTQLLKAKSLNLARGTKKRYSLSGVVTLEGNYQYFVTVQDDNGRRLVRTGTRSLTVSDQVVTRYYRYYYFANEYRLSFGVKTGLNNYLSRLPAYNPWDMRYLENSMQKPELQKLTVKIKRHAAKWVADHPNRVKKNNIKTSDVEARIAISLAQRIPYGNGEGGGGGRHPYEVLYDKSGDCDEKSRLAAFILRDLGYGTCLFEFPSHMAVGIKCGSQYDYRNTGYCFFEATSPAIIGFVSSVSGGAPDVYRVGTGTKSFDAQYEYPDAQWYKNNFFKTLTVGSSMYKQRERLKSLYGLEIPWHPGAYIT